LKIGHLVGYFTIVERLKVLARRLQFHYALFELIAIFLIIAFLKKLNLSTKNKGFCFKYIAIFFLFFNISVDCNSGRSKRSLSIVLFHQLEPRSVSCGSPISERLCKKRKTRIGQIDGRIAENVNRSYFASRSIFLPIKL
jgi:hypothetical protein